MFCGNCGAQLADGTKFCPNCGAPVAAPQASAPQMQVAPVIQAAPEPEPVAAPSPEQAAQVEEPVTTEPVMQTAPAPEPVNVPEANSEEEKTVLLQPEYRQPSQPAAQVAPQFQGQPAQNPYMQQPQFQQVPYGQPVAPQPQGQPVASQYQGQPVPPVAPQPQGQPVAPQYQGQPVQPVAPQFVEQPAYNQMGIPQPVKKKKSALPIICIIIAIIILIGGGVGAYLYMSSPYQKSLKAIDAEDYETVAALYPELTKDEDKDTVNAAMDGVFTQACSDYINKYMTYDEVKDLAATLKPVLSGNSSYTNGLNKVETIETSRQKFEKAEELFNNEEYFEAYDTYQEVSSEDTENYSTAQDRMVVCEDFMHLDTKLMGTWMFSFDGADRLAAEMDGVDFTNEIMCDVYFEFYDDYSLYVYMDVDKIVDQMLPETIEAGYAQLIAETGYDRSTIDDMFESVYGFTYGDFIEATFRDGLSDIDNSEVYTWEVVDRNQLHFIEPDEYYTIKFDGNDIVTIDASESADSEFFGSILEDMNTTVIELTRVD